MHKNLIYERVNSSGMSVLMWVFCYLFCIRWWDLEAWTI